jgi:uncharacterized protein
MKKHVIYIFLIVLFIPYSSNAANVLHDIEKTEKECEAGDISKCHQAASAYKSGRGVKKNIERATELWNLACNRGHSFSCYNLGHQVLQKNSDLVKALPFFKKACEYGDLIACNYVEAVTGASQARIDVDGSIKVLINSCIAGNGLDCYKAGKKYQAKKRGAQDLIQAFHFFQQGCEKKFNKACAEVAAAYEQGYGVEQSSDEAMRYISKTCRPTMLFTDCAFIMKSAGFDYAKFMKKACLKGDGKACEKLGLAAYLAIKQPEVRKVAVTYYEMACNFGNKFACEQAAKFHLYGIAVPQNSVKSRALLDNGCAQGDKSSCIRNSINLSDPESPDFVKNCHANNTPDCLKLYEACEENNIKACYLFAVGVEEDAHVTDDAHAAVAPFQKACDGGNMKACKELARLYISGWGAKKDGERAVQIIRKACDKGDIPSCGEFAEIYFRSGVNNLQTDTVISYMERGCRYGKGCNTHIPKKFRATFEEKWQLKLQKMCVEQNIYYACNQFTLNALNSKNKLLIFSYKECNKGAYLLCEQVAQHLISYKGSCKNNYKNACENLDEYRKYIKNQGHKTKIDIAAEIQENLLKSCIGGYREACYPISENIPKIDNAVLDPESDNQECMDHNLAACLKLSVHQNKPMLRILEEQCKGGSLQACYDFAFSIRSREGSHNYKIWKSLMNDGCQKGHGDSCYQIYRLTKDKSVKFPNMEKACNIGSKLACDYLVGRGERLAVF